MPGASRSYRRAGSCILVVSALVAFSRVGASYGQDAPSQSATLAPGAVEAGISGTMTTIEGITSGSVLLRGGYLFGAARGLVGVELTTSYRHISSLDEIDIEGSISWQHRLRDSSTYPFLAVSGGLRHEDIGSFGQNRYPIGFTLGLRSLIGRRAGFRVEYQFRRVLNDPVKNPSENRIVAGISVFFRNRDEAR